MERIRKKSGISVEWEELTDIGEKKNIILTRKELPDAFYQVDCIQYGIIKVWKTGTIYSLRRSY